MHHFGHSLSLQLGMPKSLDFRFALVPGCFTLKFWDILCSNTYLSSLVNMNFSSVNGNLLLCFRTPVSELFFQNSSFRTPVSEHLFQNTCFRTPVSEHCFRTHVSEQMFQNTYFGKLILSLNQ